MIEKTAEEIKQEIAKLEKQIISLTEELQQIQGTILVDITTDWCDPRKGKPFFALLSAENGKAKRNFIDVPRVYDRNYVKLQGTAELPVGRYYDYRVGGSWKNDYRQYGIITEQGLCELGKVEVARKLQISL